MAYKRTHHPNFMSSFVKAGVGAALGSMVGFIFFQVSKQFVYPELIAAISMVIVGLYALYVFSVHTSRIDSNLDNLVTSISYVQYVDWKKDNGEEFYRTFGNYVDKATESIYAVSPVSITKPATKEGDHSGYRRAYYQLITNRIRNLNEAGRPFTYVRIFQQDTDETIAKSHGPIVSESCRDLLSEVTAKKNQPWEVTLKKISTRRNHGIMVIDHELLIVIIDSIDNSKDAYHEGAFFIYGKERSIRFENVVKNLANNGNAKPITLDDLS